MKVALIAAFELKFSDFYDFTLILNIRKFKYSIILKNVAKKSLERDFALYS